MYVKYVMYDVRTYVSISIGDVCMLYEIESQSTAFIFQPRKQASANSVTATRLELHFFCSNSSAANNSHEGRKRRPAVVGDSQP